MKTLGKILSFQAGFFLGGFSLTLLIIFLFAVCRSFRDVFEAGHPFAIVFLLLSFTSTLSAGLLLWASIYMIRQGLKGVDSTQILVNLICLMFFSGGLYALIFRS